MASQKGQKDSAMAAHLVRQGLHHGIRKTHTHAEPIPNMKDVGSAAYRRRLKKS